MGAASFPYVVGFGWESGLFFWSCVSCFSNPFGFSKGARGLGLRAGAGALPLHPTRALPWACEGPSALSTPIFLPRLYLTFLPDFPAQIRHQQLVGIVLGKGPHQLRYGSLRRQVLT